MDNGYIMPHSKELEQSVLGGILYDPNMIEQILELLVPTDFYYEKNMLIFQSMSDLYNKSVFPDMINIQEHLRSAGKLEEVGGMFYLSELLDYSSFDTKMKAQFVKQKALYRDVIYLSDELQKKSFLEQEDVFSLINFAIDKLSTLTNFMQRSEVYSVGTVIKEIISNIEKKERGELKNTILKTCLSKVEFYGGGVAIIAAKPGTGKTAFMLSSAKVQSKSGHRVGIMSIEMNEILLTSRVLQEETKLSGKKMLSYDVDSATKQKIYESNFFDLPMYINPCHGLNDKTLYSTISMMIRKYGCEIIYIDYIQLIEGDNYRDTELMRNTNIMKQCTKAAKFFNIPIVVLCQMSRGDVTISNLDEKLRGGGIEQGASQIFGLDHTNIDEQKKQWNLQDEAVRGVFKIINSKDRNDSPFGESYFYFNQPLQVIEDLNREIKIENYGMF